MWIVYRIAIAVIALVILLALFVCQYRLSSRLARRETVSSTQVAPDGADSVV